MPSKPRKDSFLTPQARVQRERSATNEFFCSSPVWRVSFKCLHPTRAIFFSFIHSCRNSGSKNPRLKEVYMRSLTRLVRVWNCMRAFQVPREVMNSLGLWSKRTAVRITIRRRGRVLYKGLARLTSGSEVRSGNAVKGLRVGEQIVLTVSRF